MHGHSFNTSYSYRLISCEAVLLDSYNNKFN